MLTNDKEKKQNLIRRFRLGFTMAELLIVVAITIILAAFGFVNVIKYQKDLHQTELDNTAREIFVAAQNHLTIAKSSGKWNNLLNETTDSTAFGNVMSVKPSDYPDTDTQSFDSDTHNYRYFILDGSDKSNAQDKVIETILPTSSIDETLRPTTDNNHTIVIEYDAKQGIIYGVWFTDGKKGTFGGSERLSDTELTNILSTNETNKATYRTSKDLRRNHEPQQIGYYGGGVNTQPNEKIKEPDITLVNADLLYVKIPNIDGASSDQTYFLEIHGDSSQADITLEPSFLDQGTDYQYFLLDSVTDGYTGHFAKITEKSTGKFYPGENLTLTVKTVLGTQFKEKILHTNSLFASVSDGSTAHLAYGRHLQNLSTSVSSLNKADTDKFVINKAVVDKSIDWSLFYTDETNSETRSTRKNNITNIYNEDGFQKGNLKDYSFYSIVNSNLSEIDGNNQSISNLKIRCNENESSDASKCAGLIANNYNGSDLTITNLTLADPSINSGNNQTAKNAGYFIGKADSHSVSIINSKVLLTKYNSMNATVAAGSAIGKIASDTITSINNVTITSNDNIEVNITSNEDAGGLVGQILSANLNIKNVNIGLKGETEIYAASGNAGGFIGSLSSGQAEIENIKIETSNNLAVVARGRNNSNTQDNTIGNAAGFIGCVNRNYIEISQITIEPDDSQREKMGITIDAENNGGGAFGYISTRNSSENSISNFLYDGGENGIVKVIRRASGGFIGRLESHGLAISDTGTTTYVYTQGTGLGRAGGFIGYIEQENNQGTVINSSYYGGRTNDSAQYDPSDRPAYTSGASSIIKGGYNIVNEGKTTGSDTASAGGFIGTASRSSNVRPASIQISNCYTTGSVYERDTSGGASGGFIGKASNDNNQNNAPLLLTNNYATGKVYFYQSEDKKQENIAGAFSGLYYLNSQSRNNYYLSNINKTDIKAYGKGADDQDDLTDLEDIYADTEKTQLIIGKASSGTGPFQVENNKQHSAKPYDVALKGNKYPYEFITDLSGTSSSLNEHVGDWPVPQKVQSFDHDFAVLYYEKVQHGYDKSNTEWYYHGYCADAAENGSTDYQEISTKNTLNSSGTLNNNGLLLAPNGNEYVSEDGYIILVAEKYTSDLASVAVSNDWSRITLANAENKGLLLPYDEVLSKLNIQGYKAYFLNPNNKLYSAWNSEKPFNFYIKGNLNDNNEWDWKAFAEFHYLPVFADCIAPRLEKLPGEYIRSASQLHWLFDSSLGKKYIGNSGSADVVTQTMDIDFSSENVQFSFKGDTVNYQTTPYFNETLTGTYQGGKKTDGTFYCLKNLNHTLINTIHSNPRGHLQNLIIENYNSSSGLVNSNNGYIENISINNGNITNNNGQKAGILVNNDNIGTINAVSVNNFKIDKDGLIGGSNNGAITSTAIINSDIGGNGFVGGSSSGKIEKSTINSTKVGKNGLIGDANTGEITGIEINDVDIGGNGVSNSISGDKDNNITLKNVVISNYGIAEKISGHLKNTFIVNASIGKCGIASSFEYGSQIDHVQIYSDTTAVSSNLKYFKVGDIMQPYSLVQIGVNSEDNVSGFVYKSSGTITNCSITGTINSNKDASGFVYELVGGSVTNSYANTIINTAKGNAAGFVYQSDNSGPQVNYVHALGIINAVNASGFIYDDGGGQIQNSYSAVWKALTSGNYYPFAINGNNYSNCYYMKGILGANNTINNVTSVESSQLKQLHSLGTNTSQNNTIPYYQYMENTVNPVYPYPVSSDIKNYGDWLEYDDVDGTFAYIEYIKNGPSTVYLYDEDTGKFTVDDNSSMTISGNNIKSAYAFLVPVQQQMSDEEAENIRKRLSTIYTIKDDTNEIGFTTNESEFSLSGYKVFRITNNDNYDFTQLKKISLLKNNELFADINLKLGFSISKPDILGTEEHPYVIHTSDQYELLNKSYGKYYENYFKIVKNENDKNCVVSDEVNNKLISISDQDNIYYLFDGKMPGINTQIEDACLQTNTLISPNEFPAIKPQEAGEGIWGNNITLGPTGLFIYNKKYYVVTESKTFKWGNILNNETVDLSKIQAIQLTGKVLTSNPFKDNSGIKYIDSISTGDICIDEGNLYVSTGSYYHNLPSYNMNGWYKIPKNGLFKLTYS